MRAGGCHGRHGGGRAVRLGGRRARAAVGRLLLRMRELLMLLMMMMIVLWLLLLLPGRPEAPNERCRPRRGARLGRRSAGSADRDGRAARVLARGRERVRPVHAGLRAGPCTRRTATCRTGGTWRSHGGRTGGTGRRRRRSAAPMRGDTGGLEIVWRRRGGTPLRWATRLRCHWGRAGRATDGGPCVASVGRLGGRRSRATVGWPLLMLMLLMLMLLMLMVLPPCLIIRCGWRCRGRTPS